MTAAQQPPDQPAPAILVVDDEDYVADMIASALEMEGYSVHVAYNGRDGLDLALRLSLRLIIIDLMMPYLNGEALARQVHDQAGLDHVPIILISAGARPRQMVSSVTFMAKPFDLLKLLALVEAKIGDGAAPDDGATSPKRLPR